MRYIELDELELYLPDDWDKTVESAWAYVNKKIDEAEQKILQKSVKEAWDITKLNAELETAKANARKNAISAKSGVWSQLGEQMSKISNGKCWYCETNELRSDKPIDHFRPKNSVAECPDHPGYWWLAFEWRNYRYCCTYCNSRRVDVKTAGGKQDHFPIITPPQWNTCKTDVNRERPKLLDPTNQNDYSLLTFDKNGQACPNSDDENSEDYLRAKESIEKYHLNHKPTKMARQAIRQRIDQLVASTNESFKNGHQVSSEQISTNIKEIRKLIRFTWPDSKFITAAKLYLRQYYHEPWVKTILDRE